MKRFVIEVMLFAALAGLMSFARPLYLLRNEQYQDGIIGSEVYEAVRTSRRPTQTETVIAGDSVTYQFFHDHPPGLLYESLACNGTISMAGHYMLVKQFLENNPQTKRVVLILHPSSFSNDLNYIHTYRYFIKPFYNDEFKPEMTQLVLERVRSVPLYWLAWLPQIKTSNWGPTLWNYDRDEPSLRISPIAKEHLPKLIGLQAEFGVQLQIAAPPLSKYYVKLIDNLDASDAGSPSAADLVQTYKDSIRFLPSEKYVDEVHFSDPKSEVVAYVDFLTGRGINLRETSQD